MTWGTAWALARRGLDWRFRGLRLLLACLVLGTAALSAIGTLTGAIERELVARGRVMLGGDVELSLAGRAASGPERAAMDRLGTVSAGLRLQAMARQVQGDAATPVELKAVDARWPLYGALKLEGRSSAGAPQGMAAWIAPGVADRLEVKTGDRLQVGNAVLTVAGVIADEPDRLGEGFALGPTVIVSQEALAASGLVQTGSMARWKYRLRLPAQAEPATVADAFKAQFPDGGFGTRTRDRASPGLDRFVSRMGQFLTLVALAALSIAGIGIGNGVSSYLEARRGSIATLKILGATSADVARIFLLQIAAASAAGIAIGLAIGVGSTPLIARALQGLLPVEAGFVFDASALALAAAYGALIALTFAAPPLLAARETPAMALMRAGVSRGTRRWRTGAVPVVLGLGGIAALAIGTSPQPLLAAGFLGGSAALFGLLWLVGWGVTRAAARLPAPRRPLLRMALRNLHRPGAQTGALVLALGFALSAFVLLAAVETSLDANIARSVPARAPDYFVLDLPKAREGEFRALVDRAAPGAQVRAVPALRGAITAFGPADRMTRVADLVSIPDDAWALKGDRGLTYADAVPEGNVVTAGQWWPKDYAGPPLVSVDETLAQVLGLRLGDRISITLLGVERSATIASFRRIDWETMGFNYVLVFSPNALADAPHNLAATIELPAGAKTAPVRRAILSGLVRALPSSSVIEVGPVLSQARDILSQMGTAVLAAASVAVLAGMAVLAGAIAAAREARSYDSAVLRVLGAGSRQVLGVLLAEYALLCAVLAALSLALGLGVAWGVVTQLFEFDWLPGWGRIAGVLTAGIALVLALALGGSAAVLRTRPARVLREL
ncbi:ABC transporter permease [Novosphingobium cyanobacteriorum]|uniref:FtsX-like permease family protein n=1 Tax=Novosphingobium cyanobacteriorum TaxID=3024215 RepID=A0ABT6CEM1_9SPHN|nr:FtsX-like permease family protein [Novosphingobium cyanobacteriorum]MDF8332364.1 FtsX-like permease family protein [Novosphingobium cyanobacteriorum]